MRYKIKFKGLDEESLQTKVQKFMFSQGYEIVNGEDYDEMDFSGEGETVYARGDRLTTVYLIINLQVKEITKFVEKKIMTGLSTYYKELTPEEGAFFFNNDFNYDISYQIGLQEDAGIKNPDITDWF